MKTVFAILALAVTVFAQSPSIVFTPIGFWPICEAGGATGILGMFCQNAPMKGSEPDALNVWPASPATTGYVYVVTGTDTLGVPKTLTGQAARADNSDGFTSIGLSAGLLSAKVVIIDFSGSAADGTFAVLSVRRL